MVDITTDHPGIAFEFQEDDFSIIGYYSNIKGWIEFRVETKELVIGQLGSQHKTELLETLPKRAVAK